MFILVCDKNTEAIDGLEKSEEHENGKQIITETKKYVQIKANLYLLCTCVS